MESFSFLQISDHHLGDSHTHLHNGYATNFVFDLTLRQIAAAAHPVDFLLSTGDLVDPPTGVGYSHVRFSLGIENASLPPGPLAITRPGMPQLPFYCLPGNHDDRATMAQVLFGVEPRQTWNTTFTHKGVQFICLDWGAESQAAGSPEMWQFLEDALSRPMPAVLFSHHAVTPIGARWLDNFIAEDIDRFWEIVTGSRVRNKVLGILCGHTHITYDQVVENIPVLGLRSTCFTFALADHVQLVIDSPHYRLVNISAGALTSRIYEVPLPAAARIENP